MNPQQPNGFNNQPQPNRNNNPPNTFQPQFNPLYSQPTQRLDQNQLGAVPMPGNYVPQGQPMGQPQNPPPYYGPAMQAAPQIQRQDKKKGGIPWTLTIPGIILILAVAIGSRFLGNVVGTGVGNVISNGGLDAVVPSYPAASKLENTADVNDFFKGTGGITIKTYSTADDIAKVKSYFVSNFAKNGWKSESAPQATIVRQIEDAGGFDLYFTKGLGEKAEVIGFPGSFGGDYFKYSSIPSSGTFFMVGSDKN